MKRTLYPTRSRQPNGGLVVTRNGDIYGTTYYGGKNFFGTVFRYTP